MVKNMRELNECYADIIRNRYEENVISGKDAVKHMENSTAVFRGVPVACLYMPKLFTQPAWDYLNEAANTIITIIDKVINRYMVDTEYRKLFPFPKELEELILTEAGYPRMLPIARLDIFFNEEDFSFQFCEFNADGASGMTECLEINAAVQKSDAFSEMSKMYNISTFELFDTWVHEFMNIYNSYDKKVENPRVVISDFMDKATPNEFKEFQKAFQRAGIHADICDIRELDFSKLDAIYRRAVTRDIMERKNEVKPFLESVRSLDKQKPCVIGHFRTQVIHTKSIFMIMRRPETLSFLTEKEQEYILRHIPETLPLPTTGPLPDGVLEQRSEWLVKPEDFYASKGVYAGIDMDPETWKKTVSEAQNSGVPYLLQKYCTPYRSLNIDFNNETRPDFMMYNNITGMYIYNGKLVGLYSRAGQKGTISSLAEGKTLASMLAKPISL